MADRIVIDEVQSSLFATGTTITIEDRTAAAELAPDERILMGPRRYEGYDGPFRDDESDPEVLVYYEVSSVETRRVEDVYPRLSILATIELPSINPLGDGYHRFILVAEERRGARQVGLALGVSKGEERFALADSLAAFAQETAGGQLRAFAEWYVKEWLPTTFPEDDTPLACLQAYANWLSEEDQGEYADEELWPNG